MNDYPEDIDLKKIKEWEVAELKDYHELMNFVFNNWKYADCGYWKQDGDIYYISTAGWSGNEEIIASLRENQMFWLMYWYQEKWGGHYIFAPHTLEAITKLAGE